MKMRSIRSKILIAIIGITLAAALLIAGLFYRKSSQMIEQNYITLLQQRIRTTTDGIDDTLQNICGIGINASCDSEIMEKLKQYVEDGNEDRLNEISERLRIFMKENSLISSMYLVIPQKKQIVTTLDYPVYKSNAEEAALNEFEKAIREESGPVILDDIVHDGEKILLFVQTVEDEDGETLGYLCTNIEEQKLSYGYFRNPAVQELGEVYLLKDGRIAASDELSVMGTSFDETEDYAGWMNAADVAGSDEKNIYIYCEGAFSGCGIFARVERNAVLSDMQQMKVYIGGIVAFTALAALAAAAYLAHLVYQPVKKLKTAIGQVSEGDIDVRAEVVSQDEIGMAAEEFNRMLDRLEELMHRLVAEEKQKRDAELEALQYQITPHFMYNTLNSIKYYALLHQEKELAGIIEDFVELLQTCIRKKGAFLTVAEEVQVLQNYIHLQEFRNGENYEVHYEIGENVQQYLVPRLILQPLVENAILHGMDIKKKRGELAICVWKEEGTLCLTVRDNGRGMSRERIEELLQEKGKKTRGLTAVGIPNILERLKLYYGDRAGLSFESSPEGTIARIYLPAEKEEDEAEREGRGER